jgi:predicted RNA-binding Zn ribbon-like protein
MPVSSPTHHRPPHGLELVIDFVNTLDLEADTDELSSPRDLARWLDEHELLPAGTQLRERQRRQAIGFREALRSLSLSHSGGSPDPQAAGELEAVAIRGQLSVRFGEDGSASFTPRGDGFAGALAKLLVPIAEASRDGSWQRVKACRSDDCQWAFYDHSRNRSGVWCDMSVCGNRTKVRAYRLRGTGAG